MKKENEILELHSKGMNTKDIAIYLAISRSTVMRVLKKNNLKSNNIKPLNPRNFKEEDVERMIKLYEEGLTCQEIYEKYFSEKCSSKDTIQGLLNRRIGLRRRGKRIDFDETFFENIDSERKAYWLGFIYADGNITKNRLRIEIKEQDRYILEEFNRDLGSNNKICTCESCHEYNGYIINKKNVYIGYCSDKLVYDLKKLGVIPNKTFKINSIPKINRNLVRHFIRGYFDGDGTVYDYHHHGLSFGFYGQHNFLEEIKGVLLNELNLSDRKIHDKETVSMLTFSRKEDIKRFYDYIYNDSTIYLKRKKNKFKKIILQ